MRVLLADKLPEPARAALANAGMEVSFEPSLGAGDLPGRIGGHDVLVVRSTKVTADTLAAADRLQLIVRAGAGVNTIDVKGASERGIFVANCPGKNAIAVAELAIGLLLALDRRIPQARSELSAGRWNKKEYGQADGVFGKRLGVVGTGPIAREVITRAKALGLSVVAYSRSFDEGRADALGVTCAPNLNMLAANSDIVSVHLPHTEETAGLIGEQFLRELPEGAMVINTSRGGVVDEAAVARAMDERGLRYATDVFDEEPGSGSADFDHALCRDPRVVSTPHIGASTAQAQAAVADEAVRIITTFATTGEVPNCVNLRRESPARWILTVRHQDRVGVLAGVLDAIKEANINVQEVENLIFDGAATAVARIRLGSEPPETLAPSIGERAGVIDAQVRAG